MLKVLAAVGMAVTLLVFSPTAVQALEAPVEPWFHFAWVKWSWVGFDLLVMAGFFWLIRRTTLWLLGLLTPALCVNAQSVPKLKPFGRRCLADIAIPRCHHKNQ